MTFNFVSLRGVFGKQCLSAFQKRRGNPTAAMRLSRHKEIQPTNQGIASSGRTLSSQ
jgi:hypothetical protein